MAKQGYTFYPKDWGNSESVFELNLSERGLYREFIDLAMLNDNCTEIKKSVWCRKFAVSIDELESILSKLLELKLIEYRENILFVPSCETRLQLVRGGKTSKPTKEALENLSNKKPITEPMSEPITEQIEIETKIETKTITSNQIIEIDVAVAECLKDENWKSEVERIYKVDRAKIQFALAEFKSHCITTKEDKPRSLKKFCQHFTNWVRVKKQYQKTG